MLIRPYRSADCPALAELFYETVHTVCAWDYAPEQLDAWAPGQVDLAAWDTSFLAHRTLAAVEGETIVGFADMDGSGYLDRLYVHRDFQRRGVATTLCDTLEAATAAETFTTHASRTARPSGAPEGPPLRGDGVQLSMSASTKRIAPISCAISVHSACWTGSSGSNWTSVA